LATARDGDDRLSTEELIGLGYTLLGAGADSTASQLANFVLVLLAITGTCGAAGHTPGGDSRRG